jgi:hypothetical protein
MEKYQTKSMNADDQIIIQLPDEIRQHAQQIAMQKGEKLSDLVCLAVSSYVTEYLSDYQPSVSQSKPKCLDEARQIMKTFGQGLGEGSSPHNAARNHDEYLYGK